jgi:hypothetical protein
MVRMQPLMAVPMARPSQLFLATLVDPRPGTTKGSFSLMSLALPMVVSVVTFSKVALSLSASQP